MPRRDGWRDPLEDDYHDDQPDYRSDRGWRETGASGVAAARQLLAQAKGAPTIERGEPIPIPVVQMRSCEGCGVDLNVESCTCAP